MPDEKTNGSTGLSYAGAGVDIDAGSALVERIKPLAAGTGRPGVMDSLGGFGAMFDLKAAGFEDPILVAATDGVGTKLRIAVETGRLYGVGIDLVAMCVNDLICQGAEPLFFLDYFATGKLDPGAAAEVIAGVAEGCRLAGAGLIGGETAEMPGMYAAGDFDVAGFAVGALERGDGLPREVGPGDVVLGLSSDGLHSNGFSLVRKIVERSGLGWEDSAPFADAPLGKTLLTPTRIYVRPALEAMRTGDVRAMAHITGGGLTDNLPRVLPDGLGARLDPRAWPRPAVFDWLAEAGGLAESELLRTFNAGIGLALVVPADRAENVVARLADAGERPFTIGHVTEGEGVSYESSREG